MVTNIAKIKTGDLKNICYYVDCSSNIKKISTFKLKFQAQLTNAINLDMSIHLSFFTCFFNMLQLI